MAIKKYKPTTPGRRFMTATVRVEGTDNSPHKPLVAKLSKSGGRNNQGRMTARQYPASGFCA